MELLNILETLLENIRNTSLIEAIAVIFGIASVWFEKKENILVYPVGLVSVILYIYITYHVQLFADMGINVFYFVMSIYGWYMWARGGKGGTPLPISYSGVKGNLVNGFSVIAVFFILWFVLVNYTNSDVPVWDAMTTAFFVIGMYLMALKKIENWIAWMAGNFISIPLYAYKDLVFTSVQFSVFFIISVLGWIEWRKRYREEVKFA